MNEKEIPPPVNPLTIKLNITIMRFVSKQFAARWLPNFDLVVTSDIRTAEHNKEIGGAANSAHVHGLAEDVVLKNRATGKMLTESEARAVYGEFIAPNWPGYSEFEKSNAGEGYHIHWNLSREISTYSGLVSMAGIGVIGFALLNKMQGKA